MTSSRPSSEPATRSTEGGLPLVEDGRVAPDGRPIPASPLADDRLSAAELEARFEEFLFAAPSRRSVALIAEGLAGVARSDQDLTLRWAEITAQSYTELGYLLALLVPEALRRMGRNEIEAWVLESLDRFDRLGGRAAMEALRDIDGFLLRRERGQAVARFEAVDARLARLVQGLSGRPLKVAISADGSAWTDTETIYLPETIADFPDAEANAAQFRFRAAMLWGHARFGTFSADIGAALAGWDDPARALRWLAVIEAIRIEGKIKRRLPGLAAGIAAARGPWPPVLGPAVEVLGASGARIEDSLAVLKAIRAGAMSADPPGFPHAGRLDPEAARRVRAERIERELAIVQRALSAVAMGQAENSEQPALEVDVDGATAEVRIDGEALALPPEVRAAIRSLVQDLGELPPEALVPAGPAPWVRGAERAEAEASIGARQADHLYDEWDFRRNAYRAGWCHLFEHVVEPGHADYVPGVRRRHAVLISQVRRRFEALRGEDRHLKRQPDGEEVDLDALVAARADRRAGATASPNVYSRRTRCERSLAVMFMVDMSGSTQGWINDAEREALVMLGEAVETLGDAWAVYGFSGWTRTRCDVYRVKDFDEAYDDAVCRRIAGIAARDYTRMGVAIRHLSTLLAERPAKHRLLITLSDGKPDDFADEYRSQYGIEDTRHALLEARARGVRSYCVTIDRHGADYLRHMYGPARYTVLDDVRKLPLRIAEIYRRLAT